MLEGLDALVELSRVDEEIQKLRTELEAIPGKREVLAGQRSDAQAGQVAAEESLKAAELAQRQSETDLQEREALLQRLEGQQHQVKSNEAYTTLLHEMEQARQAISTIETSILEGMESLERAGVDLERVKEQTAGTCTAIETQEGVLSKREAELEASLGSLGTEREQVAVRVGGDVMAVYKRVAGNNLSPNIAKLSRSTTVSSRLAAIGIV